MSPEAVLTFEKQQSLNSQHWHFPKQTALRRPIAALTFSVCVCVCYVGHMALYSTLKKVTSSLNAVRHTRAPLSTSIGSATATLQVHTCGVSGPLHKKVTHLGESHSKGFFIKSHNIWPLTLLMLLWDKPATSVNISSLRSPLPLTLVTPAYF